MRSTCLTKITNEVRVNILITHICCTGAFSCVLTQCKEGKTSALVFQEKLLLHINPGKILQVFQTIWIQKDYSQEQKFQLSDNLTESMLFKMDWGFLELQQSQILVEVQTKSVSLKGSRPTWNKSSGLQRKCSL